MRRVLPLLVLAGLLASSPARATMGHNDPQLWIATKLNASLADQLRLRVELESRLGDGMSTFYSQHGDMGLSIKALSQGKFSLWVDLMYRQAFTRGWFYDTPTADEPALDGWYTEYRPFTAFTGMARLGRFTLGLSVNLEGRFFDRIPDQLRFGQSVFLGVDIQASDYGFRMFVDARITSVLHPDADFFRMRFYAGFMFPIVGPLGLNFYYMYERFRTYPGWWAFNVIGTAVTFTF